MVWGGRTRIDLIGLAGKVEDMVADIPLDIKVAVMGCVVNGPGEAKEADIGIAGGIGEGLLIRHGEVIKKVPEDDTIIGSSNFGRFIDYFMNADDGWIDEINKKLE